MRLFEILLIIMDCAGIGYALLSTKASRIVKTVYTLLLVLVLANHFFHEGWRWQMIPAYVVAMLLVIVIFMRRYEAESRPGRKGMRYSGYAMLTLFLGVSIFLSLALPVFNLPQPEGPYAVGRHTFHFTDEKRVETLSDTGNNKRELMVDVYYPAASERGAYSMLFANQDAEHFRPFIGKYAEGLGVPSVLLEYWKYITTSSIQDAVLLEGSKYPLILLSHGLGTSRLLHVSQAEHLASQGYVVATIDHTYSTEATIFPDGRMTGFQTELGDHNFYSKAAKLGEVWTGDVSFVIDEMEKLNSGQIPSVLKDGIDMSRIGTMGHSFGGATAYNAAYTDQRVGAGIVMDGTLYSIEEKKVIQKPFLFMQAEEFVALAKNADTASLPKDIREHLAAEQQLIRDNVSNGGYALVIAGTGHYNYTDLPLYSPLLRYSGMSGSIAGTRGADIVNAYVLDFFNKELKGTNGALISGDVRPFSEVIFQSGPEKLQE